MEKAKELSVIASNISPKRKKKKTKRRGKTRKGPKFVNSSSSESESDDENDNNEIETTSPKTPSKKARLLKENNSSNNTKSPKRQNPSPRISSKNQSSGLIKKLLDLIIDSTKVDKFNIKELHFQIPKIKINIELKSDLPSSVNSFMAQGIFLFKSDTMITLEYLLEDPNSLSQFWSLFYGDSPFCYNTKSFSALLQKYFLAYTFFNDQAENYRNDLPMLVPEKFSPKYNFAIFLHNSKNRYEIVDRFDHFYDANIFRSNLSDKNAFVTEINAQKIENHIKKFTQTYELRWLIIRNEDEADPRVSMSMNLHMLYRCSRNQYYIVDRNNISVVFSKHDLPQNCAVIWSCYEKLRNK